MDIGGQTQISNHLADNDLVSVLYVDYAVSTEVVGNWEVVVVAFIVNGHERFCSSGSIDVVWQFE